MFLTFEGLDGSGKTTQVQQTVANLRMLGYDVLLTREPGGTDIGDQIRSVLHSMDNTAMHPRTEILMYSASRAQLVNEVIRPYLAKGGLVVCDRYADSTMAYQGYGHGLDLDELRQITQFATGGLRPDITVYLDIAPEDSLQRRLSAAAQGEEWNRLDNMAMEFHRRVRDGYHRLISAEPARWLLVAGAQPVEQVQADIMRGLQARLQPAPARG